MSHFISLAEAITMTTLYRGNRETILNSLYQGQAILPLSETFDRAAFDAVLSQPDCSGLRIYYGMDADYKVHAVIVGVNAADEDILPGTATQLAEEELIIEKGIRCPELCPTASDLNM